VRAGYEIFGDVKLVTSHYPRAGYFSITYKGKKVVNFFFKPLKNKESMAYG